MYREARPLARPSGASGAESVLQPATGCWAGYTSDLNAGRSPSETMRGIVVTHSHHSGVVPFDLLVDMLGEDAFDDAVRGRVLRHLFDQGDPFTDRLFHLPGADHIEAPVSRFVVDLNRRRDFHGPNGVIKLTDFDAGPLYPGGFELTDTEIERRLVRWWDPFHGSITRALRRPEAVGFLDAHSMTPTGPALGPDGGALRPAFNLITGGDLDGEPVSVQPSIPGPAARRAGELLWRHFRELVRATPGVPNEVLLNAPFAVGGIQSLHGAADGPSRKPGFGLEFNRALYLEPGVDGFDRPIPGRIVALNARLRSFARELAALLADVPPVEGAP